ncbi:oligosaccharide flippase family protein [Urbifossiella limnaea]|uniref:Polysaccharide biosynthesis protein n=1 Tax=Urbifossiella limnaea TaxID=2528023 RepID=A0A517XZB3_9BACT|nr:oligosaccharide flippase family protein [Urbifossiella limnaea]QDU22798.1 Polysaccharide biosynthesis protein [Urbifossiella limnaea]
MPASRSLAVAAATNWAAFACAMAVSFLMAPYLIRGLGDARYGVWCVVENVLAYFTLLDLGVAACLVRFVARHHAAGERDELNRLVSACLAVFVAAAGVVLVAGAALVPFVGPGLERRLGEPGDVSLFMLLMLLNVAATLPLSVFPTILDGLQRFGAKSAVRLIFLALRVGGIVVVMETRPGLLALGVVFTVTNLLEHAATAWLAYRYLPGLRISRRLIDRATLHRVKGYSLDSFLAMLAGRVTVQTGAIVVGGFAGVVAAAHYAVAARLVETAKGLLRSVTTTLTPAVSEREATGDLAGVRAVFLVGTRWVLYLVLPVHLGVLAFGRPFLERWVGADYAVNCFPAAAILSATLTIGVAQSAASRILYGMGKLRLFARLALVEAALNLGMSLVLVGPYGLEGVAVAVAAPNLLFCAATIGTAAWVLQVSAVAYLRGAWLRPLLAALLPTAVWAVTPPADATWGAIAFGIACGLGPYALAVAALEWVGRSSRAAAGVVTARASTPVASPAPRATARG